VADKEAKWELNAQGKFYVDDQCIACDACVMEAPKFFMMNDEDGYAYVTIQPTSEDELEDANNALAACPVEAIGDDG
jgi:ferredoxin